ncbi:MAG: ATP-binding protein [Rhodospirillales bacterium]|nr:ATP-binding protein [Rhodospirillales bacterium]
MPSGGPPKEGRKPLDPAAAGLAAGASRGDPAHSDLLFAAIANFTYDWESWIGLDGKPRWVNPAVERITGYTPEQCLAMPDYPLSLVREEDRRRIARHLRQAATGASGNDVEFAILRKDGGLRWGAVSWQTIVDDAGNSLGYRTSVRDITERKQAESELRKAHEHAERANLAKSKFLAAASHDLRQPLQAVSMFVAALASSCREGEDAQILESIQDCLKATHELLDALLDVSRLDAGVLEPELSEFAICDLFETLELEFVGQATAKGLALRAVPSTVVVRTDAVLLQRILGNLLSNAVRYTQSGSILLGARRKGRVLRIEVWDSGPGIAADQQKHIFEEFYQLGNPERDRARGLGLGLAIVERLSRLLETPFFLRSEPGKGSVFSIEVPVAECQRLAPRAEPAPREAGLSGLKVLAIDDDPVQLASLQVLLSRWGCDVTLAASEEEALAALAEGAAAPDVVLADYRLRDGRTGTAAIRAVARRLNRSVAGIVLTGDTEPARLAEASASGFALVHKPARPDVLWRALAQQLRTPVG